MNPPIIHDEFFGELRWNDLVGWYDAEVQHGPEAAIGVSIKVGDDGPMAAVAQARRDFPTVIANEPAYRKEAATALLDTYNDFWNEEEAIDVETFLSRMQLERILFYLIYTELWYDDGDLFGGHSIYVSIDSELRFIEATFEG